MLRRGAGRPVLLLHGLQTVDPRARFLDLLGQHRRDHRAVASRLWQLAAPRRLRDRVRPRAPLPGRPRGAAVREGDADRIVLRRLARGAKSPSSAAIGSTSLVLVDAFGIKVSDRETPDILDVFNTSPPEVLRRSWHDPARGRRISTRCRTTSSSCAPATGTRSASTAGIHTCTIPSSSGGCAASRVPTLVLWGASDGIVTPSYGRAYSALHSRLALRADRAGRASSGDRAGRGLRRRGRALPAR